MKKKLLTLLLPILLFSGNLKSQSSGNPYPATDNLGRKLPTHTEVGDIKSDKIVALFYWTWHSGHSTHNKAYDLSKIIKGHPEAINDFTNSLWDSYNDQNTFFWTEPLFDFYDGKDKWVIRKQLEMLGDAGVDVLIYDASNGAYLWDEGYQAVAQVMAEAINDGVNVPQFAFLLNFIAI